MQLTVEQKIGKAITAFVVEVVIVLPIDFALISLTTQVPGLGPLGVLVESILVPADFFVTDFAISFPYDTYLDVSTGYENDFEWILTNIIVSELPQDWQDNIHEVIPGMIH